MTCIQPSKFIIFCVLQIWLLSQSINVISQNDKQLKIDSLTQVFETTDSIEVKKDVLASLSLLYRYQGNWEKHDQIIQKMLLLQNEEPDSAYLADTYNRLGISNSLKGDNEQSLKYFKKALMINKARGHMYGVSASYENLAEVYTGIGDYRSAADCLLKSLEIKKEHNFNYSRVFNLYIKLASLQQLLKTDKVDYYIDLARQELQKMDSIRPADKVIFYNELGDIYRIRKMYDSSIVCNRKVVRYSKEINWRAGIAAGLSNLAEVFYELGKIDSSIVYHRYSLKLSEEISDCDGITEEYLNMAKLYQEINKHDSVLVLANKSLQQAKQCDLLPEQGDALKFIADYYSSQKNYKRAYKYIQEYHIIIDSISSAEVKNNIAEMEAKYQNKVKEQQIELLTAENQINNQRFQVSMLTVGILLILILLILYIFFTRRRQAKFKENNLKQQLFRSQMNPHFIFNALGSIQNYLYKNQPKVAADYLARFSFLTRSILSNSIEESISLAEEIEILESYIELEKMRLNNSFDYEIKYDEELETEFINIPPMLIQPFIENAIKHGLKELQRKGLLTISFKDKEELLEVQIIDNGIGINQTMNNKKKKSGHKSMALSIFTQRMQLLRKNSHKIPLPNIVDLSLSGKQGTLVEMYLPILK